MLVADPAPDSAPNRQLSVVNRQWLLLSRFRRDRLFQLGLVLIALVVISAILAPLLAPHDPLRGDLRGAYLRPPGGTYLLGTDSQGRDLLSRVIYGARVSLIVGLVSQTIATLLGVTMGLLSGFYGRWVDVLVMRLADITLAFPTLLLLIAIAAAVNPSLLVVFVVIGAVGWAAMARLVRSQVLVLRGADYVTAARALGAPDRRLLFRHLLPNVRAQVIVAATLGAAGAMMAEAALSFVGLGVKPPTPSWGSMVADGRDLLRVAPWVSVVPGLALGLTVLGFNLVGEALREVYDPKLGRAGGLAGGRAEPLTATAESKA
jgi:peptide/nickel transport system permease protein/oligopeptide transport system permease protein